MQRKFERFFAVFLLVISLAPVISASANPETTLTLVASKTGLIQGARLTLVGELYYTNEGSEKHFLGGKTIELYRDGQKIATTQTNTYTTESASYSTGTYVFVLLMNDIGSFTFKTYYPDEGLWSREVQVTVTGTIIQYSISLTSSASEIWISPFTNNLVTISGTALADGLPLSGVTMQMYDGTNIIPIVSGNIITTTTGSFSVQVIVDEGIHQFQAVAVEKDAASNVVIVTGRKFPTNLLLALVFLGICGLAIAKKKKK